MKKKSRAVFRLVCMAITVLIGILLVFVGFNIPFTTDRFTGFYEGLVTTNEMQEGISAVYKIERLNLDTDYRKDIDKTKEILEDFFNFRNQSVKITRIGDNQLNIEIGADSNSETFLRNIGKYNQLNFRGKADGDKVIMGTEIKSISVRRNTVQGGYGAYFQFDKGAISKLESLTKEIVANSEGLYIYGGETGDEQIQKITISQPILDGALFLSGEMNTYEETQRYVSQYINGILPIKLSLESTQYIYSTEPVLNHAALVGTILTAVFVLGSIVFLCIKYRDLGLVTSLTLLSSLILTIGITASINFIQVNYFGMFAFAFIYLVALLSNIITLEKIKNEYKNGKKLPGSIRAGMNKSIFPILDLNLIPTLFGLFMFWLGHNTIKSFGFILFVGFAVNLFTMLLLNRGLINTYLTYNSTKPKKVGFKREENVDEIA